MDDEWTIAEEQFGKQIGDFTLHKVNGVIVIAWDGQWLEGSFATIEQALASGRAQVGRGR